MKRLLTLILAITLLLPSTVFVSCSKKDEAPEVSEGVQKVRMIISEQKYIVHACGEIYYPDEDQYYTYTNSKEALQNCYDAGYRVCEIDFRITSDDKLVCTHDMDRIYLEGEPLKNSDGLDKYLNGKVYERFTTIWLEDIVEFIREHNDFYVVTDIKDSNKKGCSLISEACPDLLDNFIIQIYHTWQYNAIKKLGFNNIILTLYRTNPVERALFPISSFAKKHELVGFTFGYHWTDKDFFFPNIAETGVPMYVHTVNDVNEMKKYYEMGIAAIYTDRIDPSEFK